MDADGKRVVLYVSLYTEMGGGEFGLYYLIRCLDRTRFHPILMVNGRGPLTEKVQDLGAEIVVMPFPVVMLQQLVSPAILWRTWKASLAIRRYISERQIDLIQCSDVLALWLLMPAILTLRIPIVYSVIFFYELTRAIVFNLLALVGVRYIVCLSRMLHDDTARRMVGLRKKLRLIYWGVDVTRFDIRSASERVCLREKLGLPTDKRIVGFVGRYDLWKGHHTFLNAAERMLADRDDLFFLIVGGATTGDLIPAVAQFRQTVVERIRALHLNGSLAVWDHRDDVPDVMSCLDVFVCPSDREPFGLVILEALASGVPVVCSRTVGALEVVKDFDGVYVAEPHDAQSFAGKISQALAQGSRVLNTTSIHQTLSEFSWTRCTQQYQDLYDSVGSTPTNSA